MRIGITGSTGLIGKELCKELLKSDHLLRLFNRRKTDNFRDCEQVICDLVNSTPPDSSLDGLDVLIHLAGESIANGRWSTKRKKRIWDSRVLGTENLVDICLNSGITPPKVLINASAIGFYGDRKDEVLSEQSKRGEGWLSELSAEWEGQAFRMLEAGTRVIAMRIGIVLSLEGGALAQMVRPFKMGLGGRLGNGKQYMSWIHIKDLVRLILCVLADPSVSGPVNAVSSSTTNNEFTKTLAKVLGRPSFLPAPSRILKIILGEMADALLLSSQRVVSEKAHEISFEFEFKELETALRDLLVE